MGEPLIEHLAAGLDAMRTLHRRIGRIAAVLDRFWTWASLAILLHDAGKVADGFQTMVGNGTRPPQPWGQRHEVYSLGFVARLLTELTDEERLWVATGVATHHRPFTAPPDSHQLPLFAAYDHANPEEFTAQFGPANHERIAALMQWLDTAARQAALLPARTGPVAAPTVDEFGADTYELFEQLRQRWEWPLPPEHQPDGLTAVLLQGAVTLADHVCSAHGELHTTQPLDTHYAHRLEQRLAQNGHALRPHQHQAAITDGHLLLRAPTGSGKTEAALLWANTQIQTLHHATGATPRLFYTLPYLASINAMTTRLRTELDTEDVGVAHSRASSYHLYRALAEECATDPTAPTDTDGPAVVDAAAKAVSRAAATRLFRELVRVATPYQLLRGAIAGPAHSSILLDAANSVFVLDELHAYEPRRLGMILAMLRFWEDLGGRIAILSATLPDALADLLRDTLAAPMNVVEPVGEWPARHRIAVHPTLLTGPDSMISMVANLRAGRSVLVVANNVADARALYEQLAPVARELYGPDAALLLHSRFRRADRARIEDNIRARFGTGRPRAPGLLVATQVVEVSLDVDFDVLHTSAAPLEALLQRFGRANRVAARPPAPVLVHTPHYGPRRDGSPTVWADGVYEQQPTRLAWDILTRHNGQDIDERATGDWLNQIYASDWGKRWRDQVRHARDDFRGSFLSFNQPYDDRSQLADQFDQLFNGQEAILTDDLPRYAEALQTARGAAGRLLAEEFLIPLPHYAGPLARWEKQLGVRVIDADYHPESGLGNLSGPTRHRPYEGSQHVPSVRRDLAGELVLIGPARDHNVLRDLRQTTTSGSSSALRGITTSRRRSRCSAGPAPVLIGPTRDHNIPAMPRYGAWRGSFSLALRGITTLCPSS
jgi:CRISPR-associated endonuclease/helicase Cas3